MIVLQANQFLAQVARAVASPAGSERPLLAHPEGKGNVW
jgi:hypothetical protein